jgi:putative spermidine/putrescine transport system permease protein
MTTTEAPPMVAPPPATARRSGRSPLAYLGVLPFFVFVVMFIVLPASFLVIGSFVVQSTGSIGIDNYIGLTEPYLTQAFVNSIQISLASAIIGGLFGFLLAAAAILGGLPPILRSALMTFSGVASNFAGIPLALAFVFTIGNLGLVTKLILDLTGFQLRSTGFSIYSIVGLIIVYLYFQFPLMVLVIAPSIDGLRKEWREAAENLGATPREYWRRVALPILMPSLLGATILLFGNAFGAQATAFQLSGGTIPIITLVISQQMQGDVLFNPGLGYASAMGMVAIMGVSITAYSLLQRRSERWLRR